jgi:hypothetical protein
MFTTDLAHAVQEKIARVPTRVFSIPQTPPDLVEKRQALANSVGPNPETIQALDAWLLVCCYPERAGFKLDRRRVRVAVWQAQKVCGPGRVRLEIVLLKLSSVPRGLRHAKHDAEDRAQFNFGSALFERKQSVEQEIAVITLQRIPNSNLRHISDP